MVAGLPERFSLARVIIRCLQRCAARIRATSIVCWGVMLDAELFVRIQARCVACALAATDSWVGLPTRWIVPEDRQAAST